MTKNLVLSHEVNPNWDGSRHAAAMGRPYTKPTPQPTPQNPVRAEDLTQQPPTPTFLPHTDWGPTPPPAEELVKTPLDDDGLYFIMRTKTEQAAIDKSWRDYITAMSEMEWLRFSSWLPDVDSDEWQAMKGKLWPSRTTDPPSSPAPTPEPTPQPEPPKQHDGCSTDVTLVLRHEDLFPEQYPPRPETEAKRALREWASAQIKSMSVALTEVEQAAMEKNSADFHNANGAPYTPPPQKKWRRMEGKGGRPGKVYWG